jgi:hypothetical protein
MVGMESNLFFDSPYETRPWEVQASLISLFY